MKQQIARLSPHQNAKVAAIVWTVCSLVFVVPMFVYFELSVPPQVRAQDPYANYFVLVMPILYLVIGYVTAVIGCAVYNLLFKYIGGFEYESRDQQV